MLSANVARVVAIDGPSGSGKSTIAKKLSHELNLLYVDTGAMFRAIGYVLKKKGASLEDEKEVLKMLPSLNLVYGEEKGILIAIDGEDLTLKIREHEVSSLASVVSRLKCVRKYLLDFQRNLVQRHVSCMEGRDIGTVVFPDAFVKIYLTASSRERATRRWKELSSRGENHLSLEEIERDIIERDERDMNRIEAPLKKADDAFLVNTDGLTIDEIVAIIKNKVIEKAIYWKIKI